MSANQYALFFGNPKPNRIFNVSYQQVAYRSSGGRGAVGPAPDQGALDARSGSRGGFDDLSTAADASCRHASGQRGQRVARRRARQIAAALVGPVAVISERILRGLVGAPAGGSIHIALHTPSRSETSNHQPV